MRPMRTHGHTRQECVNAERTHEQFEACLAVLRKFGLGAEAVPDADAVAAANGEAVPDADAEAAADAANVVADREAESDAEAQTGQDEKEDEVEHATDNTTKLGEKRFTRFHEP